MASDLLISDRERARLNKVREMLKAGVNPYSKITEEKGNKDQGGLTKDRQARQAEHRERSESERTELEAKWRERPKVVGTTFLEDLDLSAYLPDDIDPAQIKCSFCNIPVERSVATYGTGKPRRVTTEEIRIVDNVPSVHEKVTYFSQKVAACPDCCLHVTTGVRFYTQE